MINKEINTHEELRQAAALVNSSITQMCGTDDTDELVKNFSVAKELMIKIFKYNADRITASKYKKS